MAIGLIIAAFMLNGRYYVLTVDKGQAIRVDRWTGEVAPIPAARENWWDDLTNTN